MFKAVPDHPKFATFKSMLKLRKAEAVGYLELVWHFAARFTLPGNIGKYSDVEIEASVEWDGEQGALIAALVASRWLDRNDAHRIVVHDWSQWADENVHTQLARKGERFADGAVPHSGRLNQAERARFNSVFTNKDTDPPSDVHVGQSAAISPIAATTQPSVSHSQPESAVATVPSPAPLPAPSPAPLPGPDLLLSPSDEHRPVQVETVFDLPLIGNKEYAVPKYLYDEFVKSYPGVSVMTELGAMRAWLISNPTKRKTPNGVPRFMNSWLSKKQNSHQSGGHQNGALPVGKAEHNMGVLNESLQAGKRQDLAH